MAQVSMRLRFFYLYVSYQIYKSELSKHVWIKLNQAYISRSDNPKGHGLTTNNARIETIKESKLYRPSLETNKRCVVICDGKYSF